jgi:hypothetical protein
VLLELDGASSGYEEISPTALQARENENVNFKYLPFDICAYLRRVLPFLSFASKSL